VVRVIAVSEGQFKARFLRGGTQFSARPAICVFTVCDRRRGVQHGEHGPVGGTNVGEVTEHE
jgi:hypothetical protein